MLEFESLGEAFEAESATVDGVVACVSPMKKGKKAEYFEAKLTDGLKQMRVVGFKGGHRKRLASFEAESQGSVSLQNCQVKKARQSDELEIVLKSSSRVEASPKKFATDCVAKILSSKITLDDLDQRRAFERISVDAKVVRVGDPAAVSGGVVKQDVVIADSTSAAKITVWEADIGCLVEGTSYCFNDVVREYQQSKYLSLPIEGATVVEIGEMGEVCEDDIADDCVTVSGAEVAGVLSLQSYEACLMCSCKVEATSGNLGCCTKCNMQQVISKCRKQLNAKLLISSGDSYLALNVFGSNVCDIAQTQEVTAEVLLSASPFTLTYDNNVVTSICR